MTDVISSTALYYPYLNVNDNWLKVSLLYWDRIRRIVPKEAEDFTSKRDSPIAMAASSEGVLLNTSADTALAAAAEQFRLRVLPLFRSPEHPVYNEAKHLLSLPDAERVVTFVHCRKLTTALTEELVGMGIARQTKEWVALPDQVAGLYAVCLAAELAKRMNAPLVTDEPKFGQGGEYLLFGEPPQLSDRTAPKSLLAKVGITFPGPESVSALTWTELIKFRNRRDDERRRFRAAVEEIAARALKISDPTALDDFFSDAKVEIQSALADHAKALDEAKVSSVASALALSIPTVISSAAAKATVVLGSGATVPLGVTGIAVALVAWWAQQRSKTRKAIAECPWHYLLSVNSYIPTVTVSESRGGGGGRKFMK